MKEKTASTAIFIDKWHPKKDGKCAISIRVTFDRQKRYYPTEHTMTLVDFEKAQGSKPRGEYKDVALNLQAYEKRAADIIDFLPLFTFEAFEKRYFTNVGSNNTIAAAYDLRIHEYKEAGQIGTAITYKCAKVSLEKFKAGTKFANVTPLFLDQYEAWMDKAGNSKTTVGMYLRTLRTLFNSAIADGILSKDQYPFGKRKYEVPTGKNIKKALTIQEVGLIYFYSATPGSQEAKAKDYWLFLYLCNGMNAKDMSLLKYKNLKGDVLEFVRAKTVRTKREVEPIRVTLNEDIIAIIEKYGNPSKDPETYIFPILSKGLSPEKEKALVQQAVKTINKYMKSIAQKVGIAKVPNTYVARHSYATILQRSGASAEYIGSAMGHGSTKTTQNYLAGFEDEHKREIDKALTAFKAPKPISTAVKKKVNGQRAA